MIGVVVVSHSVLAQGILETCDMVLGNHKNCVAVCLKEGVEAFAKQLYDTLNAMYETYEEVLVIADLKGGTPYNQSLQYKLEKGKTTMEIVCGFSLPMMAQLLVTLPYANDVRTLSEQLVEIAKNSIERYVDMEMTQEDDMFE